MTWPTNWNGREIVFPRVRHHAELFPKLRRWKTGPDGDGNGPVLLSLPSWEAGSWSDRAGRSRFEVGRYVHVRSDMQGLRSFYVEEAHPQLLAWIESGAGPLRCSSDRATFTIAQLRGREDRALVCFDHSVILGHHYLAIVRWSPLGQLLDENPV